MDNIEIIEINPPYIKLEQFLKLAGIASTGGEAKNMISEGYVIVDDEVCLMRGKKLLGNEIIKIKNNPEKVIYQCLLKK